MKVQSVDERTGVWEHVFPAYRVYFYDNPYGAISSYTTYTYELTDAYNVQQVLAWADANARGRPYCVYAVVFEGGVRQSPDEEVGLLQLCGWDPNSPGDERANPPNDLEPEPEAQVQHLLRTREDAYRRARQTR